MHSNRRRVLGAGLIALTVAATAACSGDSTGATPPPITSTAAEGLTIGISFDEPGIGFKSDSGYTGFDVQTATYIAAKLGVPADKITWKEANPADREALLTSGDVDMVVSTYSITEERKQKVAFAGPYFEAHQDLLIRRNDVDITSPETLDGRNLCSVTNTTSAKYISDNYQGRINLVEKEKFSDCVVALAAGEVDAVTTDDVILAGFAAEEQYKGVLKVVGNGFTDELYGVGLPKGDDDMVAKVNAALKDYIDDGSWKKALDSTVGPSGYSLPDPPTPGTA
jgi:glutamate transport system substrate-binding protein